MAHQDAASGIERFFSAEARRLTGASLSGLVAKFAGIPDMVTLHTGIPPPASFPLSGLHLDLVRLAAQGDSAQGAAGHPERVDVTQRSAVVAAQQYEFGAGHPPLLEWVQRTMAEAHAPPAPVKCAVTSGAVHALSLACSMLLDPGEWLLCDEYTYSHAIEVVFMPKGVRPLPVRMDSEGMDPDHLEQQVAWATAQLQQWRQQRLVAQQQGAAGTAEGGGGAAGAAQGGGAQGPAGGAGDELPLPGRPPRVVYLIPTGHNPTGITMGPERKRRLYEVCRRLDLLIIEDDAYWWLHWGEQPPSRPPAPLPWAAAPHAAPLVPALAPATPAASSPPQAEEPDGGGGGGRAWHRQLPRSLLSMDVDGRVLRVDTLAKVLGPGFRVGWVTGHPTLVSKLALATQASSVGACPLAQVLVAQLLATWGPEGFSAHLTRLRELYQRKAQALEAAMGKHLAGLASWRGVPGAGMFTWLQWAGLPDEQGGGPAGPGDDVLAAALMEARVVAVPGAMCWAAKAGRPCPFLRLNFAVLEPEQLEEGVVRLARALRSVGGAAPAPQAH